MFTSRIGEPIQAERSVHLLDPVPSTIFEPVRIPSQIVTPYDLGLEAWESGTATAAAQEGVNGLTEHDLFTAFSSISDSEIGEWVSYWLPDSVALHEPFLRLAREWLRELAMIAAGKPIASSPLPDDLTKYGVLVRRLHGESLDRIVEQTGMSKTAVEKAIYRLRAELSEFGIET